MGILPAKNGVDTDVDKARSPTPPEYENGRAAGVAREELEGLTLYEKKCVLINREIDNNGFGKYQWYIWGLCGLGYFIDLIWAQAFGLILSPLQQELGFPGRSNFALFVMRSQLTSSSLGDQSGNISVRRSCIPDISQATAL